ncbi:MAG: hypothetical protein NT129_01390 [Candidatus Aenigmarchaeota archaeon]|nr:hypothetical protein [Candidatus Aenigmarchaeota archaeon]
MNKIWLPTQQDIAKSNIYYFLLDGFSNKNRIKFKQISWWTKNSTSTEHEKVIPGKICGIGEECICYNGDVTKLSLENIKKIINDKIGDKIFLIGGHYLPNPANFSFIGDTTFSLFQYGIDFVKIILDMGKKVDLVIFVNDIQLDTTKRKELYKNYIIPEKFRKTIIGSDHIRKNVNVYIIGQKKLCSEFVREKQFFLEQNKILKEAGKGVYSIDLGNKKFIIMSSEESPDSGHMRCVQACTKLLNVGQLMGYDSVIQFYPVCAKKTIDKARLIAKKLYGYNLPTLTIYKTDSCFS